MPTTTVNSVQYYFREQGQEGPLVILGHSDANSSGQWRGLMEELGGEFRLRAFDAAGQGRSQPWPEERAYSVAAESKIVDALAASEVGPIHLVGHSAGGMFMLGAALRLGAQLASLTLVEPVMFSLLRQAGKERAWEEIEQVAGVFRELVRVGQPEEAMNGFVDYWTTQGTWAAMPKERRESMIATAPKICLQWDASFGNDYTLVEFSRLSCPTLLVRGSETTLAARSVVGLLCNALPNCHLVEIEGAGHMSPITHAKAVNPHIADHIRRHANT